MFDKSVLCQYNIDMLTQKVYKNGNSVAVTIPKEYLDELKLRPGSAVIVEKKDEGVLITPKAKKLALDVDSEFAQWVEEFANEHSDVLQELAEK